MPRQQNYRSNITNITDPRFTASRIVAFPEEGTLLEEIPASFGFDYEDHLEIHFYTIPANVRLLSTTVKLFDNIVKSHIVSYNDGTFKNYLQIDFTKLFVDKSLVLIPGDYRVVINFFSEEIGSYDNRILSIADISPSRTEVELQFNNETAVEAIRDNNILYTEFILKSFAKPDSIGVIQKIFKSGVELQDPTEGITATRLLDQIEALSVGLRQTYEETVGRIQNANLLPTFEQEVNKFVQSLTEKINEKIVIFGDERIQEAEIMTVIEDMVLQEIARLQASVDLRIQVS